MTTDPRGPRRRVVAKREINQVVADGIAWHYVITLECGHDKTPNPTGVVSVGDYYHCYGCDSEQVKG